MPESSDPYTFPGTDVLRNLPDIRDPQRLAAFEANATAARRAELDAAHLELRGPSTRIYRLGDFSSPDSRTEFLRWPAYDRARAREGTRDANHLIDLDQRPRFFTTKLSKAYRRTDESLFNKLVPEL